MRALKITLSILAVTTLAACASGPGQVQGPVKLTILHTNDHHGRFWKNIDG